MKSEQALLVFNPKLPKLSKNEQAVLKLLVEAGKLIAPLYEQQEKDTKKINREEIEKAGIKDPEILSPYTVIEKKQGEIKAIPYHIKYAQFLKPIAEILNKASKITNNKEFSRFLKLQAKGLVEGSYKDTIIAWLRMKPYILDISIGPLNHFDNRIFFAKASYHAWIGVMDVEGTIRFNNYKTITLSARRKALIPQERVDNLDKIKARVVDVLVFSGFMARTKFVGVNLPMDLNIVEKYGSQAVLFNQLNDLRLQEQILPVFNKIFSTEFKQNFSLEDLRRGYLRTVALHELAHSYLYYRHAQENLKDLFVVIYELSATILGLRMAGSLLLKDRINNKQLESMITTFICRSYYLKEESMQNKSLANYGLGGTLFIKFMLESDALKQFKGLIIPNFTKVFFSINELSYLLEKLLAFGIRKDAEVFIKKYNY